MTGAALAPAPASPTGIVIVSNRVLLLHVTLPDGAERVGWLAGGGFFFQGWKTGFAVGYQDTAEPALAGVYADKLGGTYYIPGLFEPRRLHLVRLRSFAGYDFRATFDTAATFAASYGDMIAATGTGMNSLDTDATFAYLARPFAAQIWPTGDAAPGPWIGLSYEPAVFPPYFSTSGNRFTDQVDYFNDGGRPIPTEYSHAAAGPIVPAESHPSFMDSITWHFWTPEVTSEHVFLDAGECPSYTGREAVTHTVTCPGSSVTLTAPQPGRGISSQPFNYSWQVRLADGAWAPLADGPFSQPGVAAFTTSGASTRDLTLSNYTPPPIGAQPLTSFRAVVSSECGAQVALNTALESPALTVGTCRADLGRAGGVAGCDGRLDNNDFIVFIAYFFGADPAADMGQAGGLRGSDGRLDNNDFITFINLFFAGC